MVFVARCTVWGSCCLFASGLLAGCGQNTGDGPAASASLTSPASSAPAHTVPSGAGAARAARDDLPESQVQALLDTWLKAQEQRNFADYEQLYAARFEGVKRVGARVYRFDRRGWLRDRKGMFRHAFRVAIKDTRFSLGSSSAVVTFEQTWSGGRYRDVGRKQLVVVREGDKLKIAREELLNSNVVGAVTATRSLKRDEFLFVKQLGKRSFVVLDANDRALGTGGLELVDFHSSVRGLDEKKLDPDIQALSARRFALYGSSGKTCDAKPGSPYVLAHITPHFGQLQQWQADYGAPKATLTGLAEQIWDLSAQTSGRVLASEIWAKDCDGAVWARASDLPAPQVYSAITLDAASTERVLKEFRRLPGYRTIRAEYKRDYAGAGDWDADERTTRRVAAFEEPGGAERYIAVSASAPGCGDFGAEYWAIWRQSEDKLELVTDPVAPGRLFTPSVAFDANADGYPEFVGDYELLERTGERYRRSASVLPPNFDCGC